VQFSVEYPDRDLNRLTTGFRLIVAIPILIVAGTLGHEGANYGHGATTIAAGGGGVLFLAPLLLIVFRQKYPRWWYDWNLELRVHEPDRRLSRLDGRPLPLDR
jgi:hypothetical protein